MKRLTTFFVAAVLALAASAQTLNVVTGNVTTQYAADQAGEMTYSDDGAVLAIAGKTFNTSDISKIYTDNSSVSGNTVVAIGGLENGSSLSQSCYQASSWNKSTWYALTSGSDTFAFKTPSSGGNGMVVSASSEPALTSGVSVSGGTTIFDGMGNVGGTISGGSTVSLSSYSGGGMGGGPGGNQPGGGGGPGGGGWR